MKKDEVIKILLEFNKWRRGEPPYDDIPSPFPYQPYKIGEAINKAITLLQQKK